MEGDERISDNYGGKNYPENAPNYQNQAGDEIASGDGFFWENNREKRSKKEKIVIGLIAVVAISMTFFGYRSVFGVINKPFWTWATSGDKNSNQNQACPDGNCQSSLAVNLEVLKNKDTDGDGLSDYDEIYVYGSSPYLEDSDSDGQTDKAEVDIGADPNCPGAESCLAGAFDSSGTIAASDTAGVVAVPNQLSIIQILRQSLADQGVPQETIDAISDEELLALYQEYAAQAEASGDVSDFTPATGNLTGATGNQTGAAGNLNTAGLNITSLDDLKNLSAAQIRQLLAANGAPTDQLSLLSDDQLKTMFLDILSKQTPTQ